MSGSGSGLDLGGRAQADREWQLADLRRSARLVYFLAFTCWPAFFAADLYVCLVLRPQASVRWFAFLRVLGLVLFVPGWLVARSPRSSERWLRAAALVTPLVGNVLIALMTLEFDGLRSPYVQGASLVVLVYASAVQDRWLPALAGGLVIGASFFATLAVMALLSQRIAQQWRDPDTIRLLIHNSIFVVGTAVFVAITSHSLWATRRQLYEARRLGRYRLKTRIGAGGMGEVWLARDEAQTRDVALKILDRRAGGRNALARFEREARAAARLRSPNAIRVFDFGASDDGVWYIAMELLDGADLAALVRDQGPLPPARVIHLLRQACASLAEAHQQNIIHRDIKPANLFVLRTPEADQIKLLDFGIAKITSDEATLTQGEWMAGTPDYMAPEAQRGESGTLSDIYSLGAVGYFVLTGTPPFPRESTIETLLAHREDQPDAPSARLGSPVPPDLEAIILRCLAKDPLERFLTVSDLERALGQCRDARKWTADDARSVWEAQRATA